MDQKQMDQQSEPEGSDSIMMNDYSFPVYPLRYWIDLFQSLSNVANGAHQAVKDDSKFTVLLEISHILPEELRVHLEEQELTIEGKHEHMGDNSSMKRSFVFKLTLPGNVDLDAIRIRMSDCGSHLFVEAPKVAKPGAKKRSIPMERIPSQF